MKTNPQTSFSGPNAIAVEMGGGSFKLVQILRQSKGTRVSKLILKRLDEMESLSGEGLLKACGVSGLRGVSVIACLPRQMVNVRLLDLPSGDPREIADMVDLQIARQTPYSREEIVYDYRLINSERDGYTRVMLVIAQSGQVRQRVRLIEDAGFVVDMISVSTDGWLGAMQGTEAPTGDDANQVAYFDLDATYGDLLVLQRGLPLFSRSISVGARDLAADREKQEERLVQELGRALETCRNETAAGSIDRIVISGAAARLPGLVERLQDGLKMKVVASMGPVRVEGVAEDPLLKEFSITGLLGAASMPDRLQINLMPDSVSLRKAVATKARQMSTAAILVMAILALASLWVETRLQRREAYLAELIGMIKKTSQAADDTDAMRRKVSLVSARLETKLMPAKILAELHEIVGNAIAFTAVEMIDGDKVLCRGSADTGAEVGALVSALEASPWFKNVQTSRTGKGKDKIEFEIVCDIERKKP